ncbi:MAG: thiamine diphosphokinase [Ignavibacteria bacterium]
MKFRNTILILNGDMPPARIFKKLRRKDDYIICADGGANNARKAGIETDIIIGDFDSITRSTLNFYNKKNTKLLRISEQDTTDLEKSLMYVVENGLDNLLIFGAISGRPDHTLNNFSVFKRYSKILRMRIFDRTFEIYFINGRTEFSYRKGHTVSLIPMPLAEGIITKGLKYVLKGESLESGIREGALNVSSAAKVTVEFKSGELLLFKKHFL